MSKCEENRTKVCAVCTRKGKLRKISESSFAMIKSHVYAGYNTLQFPSVICESCNRILQFIDKAKIRGEDPKRKLPSISYEDKKAPPPRVTRAGATETCSCFWCRVAGLSGPEYLRLLPVCSPAPQEGLASQAPSRDQVREVPRCHRQGQAAQLHQVCP